MRLSEGKKPKILSILIKAIKNGALQLVADIKIKMIHLQKRGFVKTVYKHRKLALEFRSEKSFFIQHFETIAIFHNI